MTKELKTRMLESEQGQAIVFVAMFMVVLLGTLGLAIDGGGLFFLWRDAQNATDAATFAATYARCTGSDPDNIRNAAYEAAEKNGFETNPAQNTYVNVYPGNGTEEVDRNFDGVGDGKTEAEFVKERLPAASQPDSKYFIYVEVRAEKPKYFIQLLYPQPLIVNPNATGYCDPGVDASSMPGALAYGVCGDQTLNFTGSNSYYKGDMHSNDGIKFPGGGTVLNDTVATYITGDGDTALNRIGGTVLVQPDQTWKMQQVTKEKDNILYKADELEDLYKPGGPIESYLNNSTTWGSDYYTSMTGDWTVKSSDTVELKGLYYVDGDVTMTFDESSPSTIHPDGATIVATGTIDITVRNYNLGWEYFKGITEDDDDNLYPAFILATSYEESSNKCASGSAAIKVGGKVTGTSASEKDYTEDPIPDPSMTGVFYSTAQGIQLSGATASYKGAVIANFIDMNMSNGVFIHDPSLIPSIPPKTSIAD